MLWPTRTSRKSWYYLSSQQRWRAWGNGISGPRVSSFYTIATCHKAFSVCGKLSQSRNMTYLCYSINWKDLHACQSLRISGLGLSEFQEALSGLQVLQDCLVAYKAGSLPFVSCSTFEHGFPVLDAGNWFFSSQQEANNSDVIKLGSYVDPAGILEQMGKNHWGVYVLHNEVKYFERIIHSHNNKP